MLTKAILIACLLISGCQSDPFKYDMPKPICEDGKIKLKKGKIKFKCRF